MIHKVSGSNTKMDLFSDQTSRESMNKSAMSSFEKVFIAAAGKMLDEGHSVAEVAARFGMTEEQLQNVNDTWRAASQQGENQVTKVASAEPQSNSADEAAQAYNELHGISSSDQSDLDPIRGNSTIHSASGNQSITDVGGSSGQVRYKNSIWDSEVLQRQAQQETGEDRIADAKLKEENRRKELKAKNHQIDPEALKLAMDMGHSQGVSSVAGTDGYKFSQKLPPRGMSIFDTSEFARIPEKTAGEQMVEAKRNEKPKAKEFTKDLNAKSANSKSIFDNMIDSMLERKE